MSSTNRGTKRRKSDYYVTPIEPIKKFLKELCREEPYFAEKLNRGCILDPCAGGDKEHEMSYPKAIKEYLNQKRFIKTIDIREDSRANKTSNYLSKYIYDNIDIIISNPPFRDAMKFIKKSLDDVKNRGYVIYLLRLNYFGTQKRYEFWQKYMSKYTFVHHKRMSFTDEGGTDSIEYAHFVWQKNNYPKFSKIKVI